MKPEKVEIPVQMDVQGLAEVTKALSRAFAGVSSVLAELTENLQRIGLDKESTTR